MGTLLLAVAAVTQHRSYLDWAAQQSMYI